MPQENATLTVCRTFAHAEAAVALLQRSGFDLQNVSVIATQRRPEDDAFARSGTGDRVRYWGELGRFWDSLRGVLSGWAFFQIPGIGPVLVAGPLSAWMIAALENAGIFDGMSPLGAGLHSIGIRRDAIHKCEAALRAGEYVLLAHGASGEVTRAREILASDGATWVVS